MVTKIILIYLNNCVSITTTDIDEFTAPVLYTEVFTNCVNILVGVLKLKCEFLTSVHMQQGKNI